jgi:membrane protease YdiL (CAAX protease family)
MAMSSSRYRRAVTLAAPGRPLLPPAATRNPPVPWSVRDGVLVLAGGLLFLVAALFVTLGYFELQSADAGPDSLRAAISACVSAAFFLFLLWAIRVLIVKRYRCSWRTLGMRQVAWQWLAAVPIIYAILTFAYVLLYRGMVGIFGPAAHWPAQLTPETLAATQQPALEALVIITGTVLTPLVEELLFRGVLYQALRRTLPVSTATLISAIIFALMHLNVVMFVPLLVMGVILALVYEWSGSIVPTMLLHACNNGIMLLIILGSYQGLAG